MLRNDQLFIVNLMEFSDSKEATMQQQPFLTDIKTLRERVGDTQSEQVGLVNRYSSDNYPSHLAGLAWRSVCSV